METREQAHEGWPTIFVMAVALSLASSLASLTGWAIDSKWLQGLGFVTVPEWPVTAVSAIFLALALLAGQARAARLATVCLIPPFLLASLCLAEYAMGRDLGVDLMFFGDRVSTTGAPHAGRMGLLALFSTVALLGVAALHRRRERWAGQFVLIATSLLIGISALSIGFLFIHAGLQEGTIRLTSSLPAALSTLALSLGVLATRHAPLRVDMVSSAELLDWRYSRIVFPAVLVLSALLPLLGQVAGGPTLASSITNAFLGSIINIVIVASLLSWATWSIRREQRALTGVRRALDIAAVLLTRDDGTIVHWSRGCEVQLGWTAGEAVGRSIQDLLGIEVLEESALVSPINGGTGRLVQVRHRDGDTLDLFEQTRLIEGGDGRPGVRVRWLADISSLTRMKAALRESELRLDQALEAHDVGVFEWDVRSGEITWSKGAEQRIGFAPGTLSDVWRWHAHIHPDDVGAMAATMIRVRDTGAMRFNFRYRLTRPDGTISTMEGSGRCSYEDGTLVRVVGVHLDVTAQEQREAALEAGQAQLRSILATVPDAMIVIDEAGAIESFSAAAERLFGYTAEEVFGRNVSLLMPDPVAAMHDGYLQRRLAGDGLGEPGAARALTAIRADGTEIPVEVNLGEAWAGDRHLFIGFLHDLTPELAAEERLEKLRSEYAHGARVTAMGDMAATLAHELNQPLAAISNFLGAAEILLRDGREPTEVADLLAMAGEQSLRAGEIIRRLREFLARNEIDVRPEPVEPAIREAVALAMVGSQQYHIRTAVSVAPDADCMLADRIQVQQVLVNLLRNASDALRDCPTWRRVITVSAEPQGDDMIEIAVADRGPGIPAPVLEQLFTPFSSTKGEDGMGLGLRICRRIVEAHGGRIWAENMSDGGARIAFTLQRHDRDQPSDED